MSGYIHFEMYTRDDGKFDWRYRAVNGEIMATSGGQGYEKKSDCLDAIDFIIFNMRWGMNPVEDLTSKV